MNLSDTAIRFSIGSHATPGPFSDVTSGAVRIGRDVALAIPAATAAYGGRIIFSANAQTATLTPGTGAITVSPATGTRQVARVSASGACTTSGSLSVMIIASAVTGSPLGIDIPINTSSHYSAALLGTAIRNALAANSAVTAAYAVSGDAAQIVLTRLAGYANDPTLSINWGTTLTTAPTGASAVAGVVGVVIERTGGDSKDIYGNAISGITGINSVALFSGSTSAASVACSSLFGSVAPGNCAAAWGPSPINPATTIVMTAGGAATMDFIVIGG